MRWDHTAKNRNVQHSSASIHLRKNLPAVIEDAKQNLTPGLRWLLDRRQEWKQTEMDIQTISDEIERITPVFLCNSPRVKKDRPEIGRL